MLSTSNKELIRDKKHEQQGTNRASHPLNFSAICDPERKSPFKVTMQTASDGIFSFSCLMRVASWAIPK
jgi:hypothetical protein